MLSKTSLKTFPVLFILGGCASAGKLPDEALCYQHGYWGVVTNVYANEIVYRKHKGVFRVSEQRCADLYIDGARSASGN